MQYIAYNFVYFHRLGEVSIVSMKNLIDMCVKYTKNRRIIR